MGFAMNFSREQIQGKPPAAEGWYTLKLSTFKPAWSKQKPGQSETEWKEVRSLNLNPQLEIINHPLEEGKKVFENLNMSAAWVLNDFLHGFGIPMEEVQDGNQGTEAANFSFPGIFEGSDENPEEPEKWNYIGPLVNRTAEVELYLNDFKGRKSNKIRQYKCSVPGCTDKHSTNLASKS